MRIEYNSLLGDFDLVWDDIEELACEETIPYNIALEKEI